MNFKERMEKLIEKGITTSKEVFEVAKEKTKEIKEKTVLKTEIRRLEREAHKKLAQLGSSVYEILVLKGQSTVSKGTADIKPVLEEIKIIEKKIEETEKELKKI